MPAKTKHPPLKITAYNFPAGRVLSGKYEILSRLGGGWEGEVYKVVERSTGIERTAKFFFPQRNPGNKTLRAYATKLFRLRNCPVLIQYHTQDYVTFRGQKVPFLVSEFVHGELLSDFLARCPGKRLTPFEGLHLLHALASGVEYIHNQGEYHGDLHSDNVLVVGYGLFFDLKLVDLFQQVGPMPEKMLFDVVEMIRIFHESLGGRKHYARQPDLIKEICSGLRPSLIKRKFRTAGQLRQFLESAQWE